MSLLGSSGNGKTWHVKVTTMDADLDLSSIDPCIMGRELFDLVCRAIGLREIWYFGLQYTNKKQIPCWLEMDKKVNKQEIPKQDDGSLHLLFLVKFFPEEVEEELIQDITRHLFFLQIKQSILNMDLYCPAEASVLLASYAVQAIYGDCDGDVQLELSKLLPQCVLDQYDMSPQMWEERIRRWWTNNNGLSCEEAEMEYLKIAQDLEMYGIQYFPICNQKETDLHLGVSAHGVGIYKGADRITPRPFFGWSEIKNISFKNKRFNIKTMDKSAITFRSIDASVNKTILDLCIGTHSLYLRRRQPDSLEVQQMKVQAKEERLRRQQEHSRYEREKDYRAEVERERDRLKTDLEMLSDQMRNIQNAMKRTEETAELLAEKARVSEEEALVLSKRASEAEAECQRIKIAQIKAEESKMTLERKAREAELIAARLIQESERRAREAEASRNNLLAAGNRSYPVNYPYDSQIAGAEYGGGTYFGDQYQRATVPPDPSANRAFCTDISSLKAEIEKERSEYNQKSRHLQEQLSDLRGEIDSLKVDDRQTELDRIHAEHVNAGEDKYSTLRKSAAGSARARIQLFDGL
uniref:Moesin/ezrin/radixin homolog 1 n=1 Tax=Plectus sambesii TaxID=2011161 RepID=A0A914WWM5_9BILA